MVSLRCPIKDIHYPIRGIVQEVYDGPRAPFEGHLQSIRFHTRFGRGENILGDALFVGRPANSDVDSSKLSRTDRVDDGFQPVVSGRGALRAYAALTRLEIQGVAHHDKIAGIPPRPGEDTGQDAPRPVHVCQGFDKEERNARALAPTDPVLFEEWFPEPDPETVSDQVDNLKSKVVAGVRIVVSPVTQPQDDPRQALLLRLFGLFFLGDTLFQDLFFPFLDFLFDLTLVDDGAHDLVG